MIRTTSALAALFIACAWLGLLAAGEEYPERRVFKDDQLIFKNGEQQFGTVLSKDPDGSIRWQEQGRTGKVLIQAKDIDKLVMRQSAPDVVRKRGRMEIERKDVFSLKETVRWGLTNKAPEDALALGLDWMKLDPSDTDIGEIVIGVLQEQKNDAEVERLAKGILATNALFEPAYLALAKVLEAAARSDELRALVTKWAEKRPSSAEANAWLVKVSQSGGDLRAQITAYKRNWIFNKDAAAGAKCAGLFIRLGDYANALSTARAVLAVDPALVDCHAYIGTALLTQNTPAATREALAALTTASAGTLPPEVATYARYNLGLAHFRLGDHAQARAAWAQAEGPAGALVQAMVDHKPFTQEDKLPDGALKAVAREYAAGLALENVQHAEAKALLPNEPSERQRFLTGLAAVLAKPDDSARLRAIALVDGVESLRWQAYGMLLAQRFRDAEALLDKLPADDGFAAVYRVYAAAAQDKPERARELFSKVATSVGAPPDYVTKLAEEYAQANDEIFRDEFNWPSGASPASGWSLSTPGTEIRIQSEAGLLIFAGEQAASQDPVNRAWRSTKRDRLRQIAAVLDLSGINSAIAGIEILDDQRLNGLAYGVLANGQLAWRPLDRGSWGKWQTVGVQITGKQVTLRLDYQQGRISGLTADSPSQRLPLGDFQPQSESVLVGIFGFAEPGGAWKLAADQFEVQLKPSGGTGRPAFAPRR